MHTATDLTDDAAIFDVVCTLDDYLLTSGSCVHSANDFTDDHGKVRTIFVYDPDGILVQFDEGPTS